MISQRIYFLDALRAFAILMMLQGHFISGLMESNPAIQASDVYYWWDYCRGFTAPVFFTITGWVFTHLLLKADLKGGVNPRIRKGIRRSIELLIWGYLLRLNLPMLFRGQINSSFWQPDVLQIIGLGILFVLGIHQLLSTKTTLRAFVFLSLGLVIFFTEPLYSGTDLSFLPKGIAGYFFKGNGGVFYLFPWLGYVAIGAFLGHLFLELEKKHYRFWAGILFTLGGLLVYYSSSWWMYLNLWFPGELMKDVAYNNYLFIRLGNVFVLFALFMWFEHLLRHKIWQQIGTNTLWIYVLHYFVLYGSLTGIGLYKFYRKSLSPTEAIGGAVAFIVLISLVVLLLKPHLNMKRTIFRRR